MKYSPEQHISLLQNNWLPELAGLYKGLSRVVTRRILARIFFVNMHLAVLVDQISAQVYGLFLYFQVFPLVQKKHVQRRKLAFALAALKYILLILIYSCKKKKITYRQVHVYANRRYKNHRE